MSALLFLLLLVGMVLFLTYVPLPPASEKAVLMIIGGLMTLSTQALPKLFGAEDNYQHKIDKLEAKLAYVQEAHNKLTEMLVTRHVINGEGLMHGDEADRYHAQTMRDAMQARDVPPTPEEK